MENSNYCNLNPHSFDSEVEENQPNFAESLSAHSNLSGGQLSYNGAHQNYPLNSYRLATNLHDISHPGMSDISDTSPQPVFSNYTHISHFQHQNDMQLHTNNDNGTPFETNTSTVLSFRKIPTENSSLPSDETLTSEAKKSQVNFQVVKNTSKVSNNPNVKEMDFENSQSDLSVTECLDDTSNTETGQSIKENTEGAVVESNEMQKNTMNSQNANRPVDDGDCENRRTDNTILCLQDEVPSLLTETVDDYNGNPLYTIEKVKQTEDENSTSENSVVIKHNENRSNNRKAHVTLTLRPKMHTRVRHMKQKLKKKTANKRKKATLGDKKRKKRRHTVISCKLKDVAICKYCQRTYNNSDILKRHILNVHEKAFDKYCSVCNKGFVNMYALKTHSLTHSRIKPFQCVEPTCDNMYSTKQLLQFHYRFRHGYSEWNMPVIVKKANLFPDNSFITNKLFKNSREYFNEFGVKIKEEKIEDKDIEALGSSDEMANSEIAMEEQNNLEDSSEPTEEDDRPEPTEEDDRPENYIKPKKKRERKITQPEKHLSLMPTRENNLKHEPGSDDQSKVVLNQKNNRAKPEVIKASKKGKKRKLSNPKDYVSAPFVSKRRQSNVHSQHSCSISKCLGQPLLPSLVPASSRELKETFLNNCQICYTYHIEMKCPLKYPEHIVPNDLDYPMGFFMPDPILFGKSKVYAGKSSLYAREDILAFTRFGPLLGRPINIDDLKQMTAVHIDLEHFWPVCVDEGTEVNISNYIDTKDVTQSNWLRFLLAAPYSPTHDNFNLQRVMMNDEVYFVTTRNVKAGEELLMRSLEPPERLFYHLRAQRKENEGGICFICQKQQVKDPSGENSEEAIESNESQLPLFENTLSFMRHFRLEHNIGQGALNFAAMYICYVCHLEFNSKSECNKHKQEMHPEEKGKRPSLYHCPICYELVTCKPSVRYHRAKYHPRLCEMGPQNCPKCDKVLGSQAQLLSHLNKSHHPEDHMPVTCDLCNKVYKNAAVLKRHKDKTHDKKYYKFCDLCGKSFRDMYQLRVHSLTHSGVKPFKCEMPQCTNAFTTKQWLQKHYKSAHGFTVENMPVIERKLSFDGTP